MYPVVYYISMLQTTKGVFFPPFLWMCFFEKKEPTMDLTRDVPDIPSSRRMQTQWPTMRPSPKPCGKRPRRWRVFSAENWFLRFDRPWRISGWKPKKLKVDGRWYSFAIGWFLSSMFILYHFVGCMWNHLKFTWRCELRPGPCKSQLMISAFFFVGSPNMFIYLYSKGEDPRGCFVIQSSRPCRLLGPADISTFRPKAVGEEFKI